MLLGRLGKDPEVKDVKGLQIANFSLATSKTWKDESGEKKEQTQWTDIVCFRKTAELAGKYLKKGDQCFVEGELQTRSWDDEKTGTKRYKTEVICNNITFVGGGKKTEETTAQSSEPTIQTTQDEIPF